MKTISRWMLALALGCSMGMEAQAPAATQVAPPAQGRGGETYVPDTGELLRKAMQALQENRLLDVQAALDGAKAVAPTQLGLWMLYGDLNTRRGDLVAAESDYRKELELHPDELTVYRPLALLLGRTQRFEEARATLGRWEAADPSSAAPLALELSMLLDQGKYPDAVKVGEEALTHGSEVVRNDPEIQFYVASAELEEGHRDKAAPLLQEALRSSDMGVKNSAAYALANANLNLPMAESAQRYVLERMGLVTEGWTLQENILGLLGDTHTLAAAWDTMGWILFREGKLPEAEGYVRAAWRNTPHATVGEHLGEIEAARGNHRGALEMYQLALAASPKTGNAADSAATVQELALLKKRIAEEQKAGVRSTVTDPEAALAKLRILKLGPAGGKKEAAQYRVLLGRGKVIRAAPALGNGKTVAGASQVMSRAEVADFFPGATYSQLVHVGMLNCNGTTCEFVIQE